MWSGTSAALVPGAHYGLRVDGPAGFDHAFNPVHTLLDPYARGLAPRGRRVMARRRARAAHRRRVRLGRRRRSRASPLDHTVVYEAHVRGFSKLNRAIPEPLRGTYAGLAHDASIEYLTGLGVTTVELLPVHAFVTEQRLVRQGRLNYWGYNTLAFFAAHAPYASAAAQAEGAARGAARVRRAWCGGCTRPASR